MFIHEQTMGSSDWKLRCLKELCNSGFDPSTAIPLLTVPSDESTREAEKGTGFVYFRRGQHEKSVRAKVGGEGEE